MSLEVMQEVWKHAEVDQGTLLVLLALSDSADEATRTCYPGVTSLARKSRLSERQVQYCLKRLREVGIISIKRNASPVKTNLYKIQKVSVWEQSRDAIIAPHGANPDTQSTTSRYEVGCVSDTKPIAPKPSVTEEEPSVSAHEGVDDLFPAGEGTEPESEPVGDVDVQNVSNGFTKFWNEIWPSHKRKIGKADCFKVYSAACAGKHAKAEKVSPGDLNRCAAAYVASVDDHQYLKGPLPWLRQPGWEPFLGSIKEFHIEDLNPRQIAMLEDGRVPPSMLEDGKPNAAARYWLAKFNPRKLRIVS